MARRTAHSAPRRGGPLPVLLAVAAGLGAGLVLSAPLAGLIEGLPREGIASLPNPFAGWIGSGGPDLLLLGTDQGGGNTDVIATVRVEGGVTRITQVPRDTYIESERYGAQKINALYALGGTDAVKQELSRRLGRPIHHHLVVNLSAIRHIADQIGGIEVDVPKRMYYVDQTQGLRIDLQPGVQNLQGRELEGFLRFRHDEEGDIGRLQRQQLALQALFRKLTRPDVLLRLPALLAAAGGDLRTDMGPMELGGLLTSMGTTHLETRRLGGRPFEQNGLSYWEAEWPVANGGESPAGGEEASRGRERHRFLF